VPAPGRFIDAKRSKIKITMRGKDERI